MHVVHCLSRSILGGGPSLVLSLVSGIRRRYPDVRQTVLLPGGGAFVKRLRSLGVDVHEIAFDIINAGAFYTTPRLLKSLHPTIIHSHGRGAGLYARLTTVGRSVARVHSYHGIHRSENPMQRAFYRQLELTLLQRTALVVSVSNGEAEDIRSEYAFSPDKTIVIENEVDGTEIDRAATMPLDPGARDFFRNHPRSFVVIMIARDDAVKNYPLAVKAARRTLSQSRNIHFVFVGSGPGNTNLDMLQSQFPDRVFVAGEQPNPLPLLRKSDCLLLTSKKEGRSLTVLEAQHLGKPVVGTDVAGIREMIRHRIDGMLCNEDEDSISETLLQLSQKGKLWSELKKNSAGAAKKKKYTQWIDQYMKQYRMLNDHTPSH